MIEGTCHCGAVRTRLKVLPEALVSCNCSLCHRHGAIWAHGAMGNIDVEAASEATFVYSWGDKMIAFHVCRACGCLTHYMSVHPDYDRGAVNCRMAEPAAIADLRVRRFDGANSWEFLD